MRKILIFITAMAIVFSCSTSRKAVKTDYGFSMQMLIDKPFTEWQLDSICKADTLSTNLEDWLNTEFESYETGRTIYKYIWIKQWNDGTLFRYIITGTKEPYMFQKTVTAKTKRK